MFEMRDVITIGAVVITWVATLVKLQATSKTQTEQNESLGKRFDTLSQTVASISGDTREHGAKIIDIDRRVSRNEHHIDRVGVRVFGQSE